MEEKRRPEQPWSKLRASLYSLFTRDPASNRLVVGVANVQRADRTLDIGCGPGSAVRAAAATASESVGVDPSLPMIAIATRRSAGVPNTRFEAGSAERLPFDDDSFTVAWTVHAFHHWSDEEQGFAEVLRVLEPSGRFLIVEREGKGAHGLTRTAAEAVSDRLRDAGFARATVSKQRKELIIEASAPSHGSQ